MGVDEPQIAPVAYVDVEEAHGAHVREIRTQVYHRPQRPQQPQREVRPQEFRFRNSLSLDFMSNLVDVLPNFWPQNFQVLARFSVNFVEYSWQKPG